MPIFSNNNDHSARRGGRSGPSVNIGISGSYGGLNLGDEAILKAIVAQIRESMDAKITVYTRDTEDTLRRHDVDHAVPVREISRDEARAEIEQHDGFVLGGGGIFYDRDVKTYLREVALAHEAGVPVMIYAVSAGPLEDMQARQLVRKHLNRVKVVTVRDRQGRAVFEDAGVDREIAVTADPALLLHPETLPEDALLREGIDPSTRLVGFSVREPGPAAPDMDVDHYHALLAHAADFMVDRLQAQIVFIPMERKKMDVQHSHAVVSRMDCAKNAVVLKNDYSPGELISLIQHFEFSVGMRLHFLIFSALAGVPFVALPYAAKVTGLLEDLEMEMPPLTEVNSGRLIATIDRSWDMRAQVRKRIRRLLPGLQERARHNHSLLDQMLSSVPEHAN